MYRPPANLDNSFKNELTCDSKCVRRCREAHYCLHYFLFQKQSSCYNKHVLAHMQNLKKGVVGVRTVVFSLVAMVTGL